jgi:hypothetical protein
VGLRPSEWAWRMDGLYGQFGIMPPNHHASVSVTARPTIDILDAVWRHIVTARAWAR